MKLFDEITKLWQGWTGSLKHVTYTRILNFLKIHLATMMSYSTAKFNFHRCKTSCSNTNSEFFIINPVYTFQVSITKEKANFDDYFEERDLST